MAFLEWRKFNFFKLIKDVDDGKLSNEFNNKDIAVTRSGNHYLIFAESNGQVHLISRSWEVKTFRAYEIKLLLAEQIRNSTLLITIGEDEPGVNSLIKVWDLSRNSNGMPFCTRITRVNRNNLQACILCVHDNLEIMAIGFEDGTLLLYRGDVTREKASRQKILRESSSKITGLAFKSTANRILMFVSTENSIYIYNVTHRDKEVMSLLDNTGCALNCSCLAETLQESYFMVAKNDAIYCYNADGKGPCYAVDGEKIILQWFRSYLIIVSQSNQITVLDIHNKFIVFTATMEIKAVLIEWGGFYIIDRKYNIYHLNEKDLQSKLSLLFKKNLYDIAIRIAKSQQYDADGLIDIFRQYAQHLYRKGDHSGAMEQYIKTIGKLEPSYIIKEFMDSKNIDNLTHYLECLHKLGHANEDHTTLLLNCYTKLNKSEQLKDFVLNGEMNFDIDIAIKVCRQSNPLEALLIAKKNERHDWYMKLLIEDHQNYKEVIDYLSAFVDNSKMDAVAYMRKYGNVLLEHCPHETTQFLKKLCIQQQQQQTADPESFLPLFLNNSLRLVEFLEYLIDEGCHLSASIYDTLLEHYLHVNDESTNSYGEKILKLLQNPDILYDKHQALVVCHMNGFSDGILYLYEEQKLYEEILRYHMKNNDLTLALNCCKKFGHQQPTLWIQALWSCIRTATTTDNNSSNAANASCLPEILEMIAKERLLSTQIVLEALGTSANSQLHFDLIKPYVISELIKERELMNNDRELTNKYQKDTIELKSSLETLKNSPITIHGSRCAACNHTLELPSLHFLCQHSYHQHCFNSYSENDAECLACQPENNKLMELLKAREYNKDLNETFHSQLEKASDGFSLAAEYFGRGVFNTIKVIQQQQQPPPPPPPIPIPQVNKIESTNTYSYVQEGRKERQIENKITIISEGRMRLQEANRISSSLEANITIGKKKVEEYDESKNPFISTDDREKADNEDEDDYDKNLNPFSN